MRLFQIPENGPEINAVSLRAYLVSQVSNSLVVVFTYSNLAPLIALGQVL